MTTSAHSTGRGADTDIRFNVSGVDIDADVSIPAEAAGIVLFAQGSGSSRHNPRNQFVAGSLHRRVSERC